MRPPLTPIHPCSRWLKRRLHFWVIAFLPLLLAAAPVTQEAVPPRASRLGTATVAIVQGERIDPVFLENMSPRPDRQVRRRGEMPLVEFY